MLKRLRPRSAYDVLAVIAFFVAVGTGGAYAANTIGSADVIDESLLSQDIKNGEVRNSELSADAVTSTRLANGSVQNSDLGPDAVTTSKIKAGAVTNTDLGAGAVTGAKVQDDALGGDDVLESSLGKVGDADTLDGFDWFNFLQADATAVNSHQLDGLDSTDFLGAGATAANSDLLDDRDSKSFARLGGFVFGDGTISEGTGFTVTRLSEGHYQVLFPSGTLGSLCPPVAVVQVFAGIDGSTRHAELSGGGCSGLGAGNFSVKTYDSAGVVHDTPFMFIAM